MLILANINRNRHRQNRCVLYNYNMNTNYNSHVVCSFVYYDIQLTKMNKQLKRKNLGSK